MHTIQYNAMQCNAPSNKNNSLLNATQQEREYHAVYLFGIFIVRKHSVPQGILFWSISFIEKRMVRCVSLYVRAFSLQFIPLLFLTTKSRTLSFPSLSKRQKVFNFLYLLSRFSVRFISKAATNACRMKCDGMKWNRIEQKKKSMNQVFG